MALAFVLDKDPRKKGRYLPDYRKHEYLSMGCSTCLGSRGAWGDGPRPLGVGCHGCSVRIKKGRPHGVEGVGSRLMERGFNERRVVTLPRRGVPVV